MNRIEKKFKELRQKKGKALIPFITAGYPNLKMTEELVLALDKNAGVDIVELGVPFSDPLADGPTIQAASQIALKNGVTLEKILETVRAIRQKGSEIPIALMTYYNPIFFYGEKKFLEKAKQDGVDGLIIPDLPPEEAHSLIKLARQEDMATIFFASPTTSKDRMKIIAQASTGFIYYVSITGVTGARKSLSQDFIKDLKALKKVTDKPVCIGFGISTPEQVKKTGQLADGVIVGSAIIKEIERNGNKVDRVKKVARFVKNLKG